MDAYRITQTVAEGAGYRMLLPLDAPEAWDNDTVLVVEARDEQAVGRRDRVTALGEVSSFPVLRTRVAGGAQSPPQNRACDLHRTRLKQVPGSEIRQQQGADDPALWSSLHRRGRTFPCP
ncbi:hypothetical protein ALMP_50360 [Streptomyces sp. A012304]|nr:hypothetical protein ALMP_50360 [Streptomyces sp. A012304]